MGSISKGIALVIGNSEYKNIPALPACTNDSTCIKESLEQLGFEVMLHNNMNRPEFISVIDRFIVESQLYSTVLLYYSGHGVQIDGKNYFVPVDCDLCTTSNKGIFVSSQVVDISIITDEMSKHSEKTNILILDACRTGIDLAKGIEASGLAEMKAGNGTLIAFATEPNKAAFCEASSMGHSYYTEALLDNINIANIKIEDMFKCVRRATMKRTNSKQIPWESTSLNGDFSFNTMTEDEIRESIYQEIRNNNLGTTAINLSKKYRRPISEIVRIYTRQKSEKPGGIYFKSDDDFEQVVLRTIIDWGFTFENYRWMLNGVPVIMGDFYHTSKVDM